MNAARMVSKDVLVQVKSKIDQSTMLLSMKARQKLSWSKAAATHGRDRGWVNYCYICCHLYGLIVFGQDWCVGSVHRMCGLHSNLCRTVKYTSSKLSCSSTISITCCSQEQTSPAEKPLSPDSVYTKTTNWRVFVPYSTTQSPIHTSTKKPTTLWCLPSLMSSIFAYSHLYGSTKIASTICVHMTRIHITSNAATVALLALWKPALKNKAQCLLTDHHSMKPTA